ncbi:type II secretory pathway [Desulfuromonas versatilis]|uniref:Type II secretion system protein J n=1 Tax=Desulfuromonas versatilis TaxID=2802975 RepID=A0ABM8HY02_9BACT|nr:type II secretion system protein GspJ [Desulfuromonas versatilis]BCR05986.1 type II secretory pathway [Desulfuromonas versatilis]
MGLNPKSIKPISGVAPPGGFTLVEVLVAVTITSLLLLSVYGVFTSVSRTKQRLESDGEGYHQARVLFDRIGREVRGAFFSSGSPGTLFKGGENADRNKYLELTTTAVTPQGSGGAGIAVVQYELALDREGQQERRVLLRREYSLSDSEGPERLPYRLATGIESMQLRFYSGSDWFEEWDAASQGLPHMVEVTLSVRVGEQPVPFRTILEVPRI